MLSIAAQRMKQFFIGEFPPQRAFDTSVAIHSSAAKKIISMGEPPIQWVFKYFFYTEAQQKKIKVSSLEVSYP